MVFFDGGLFDVMDLGIVYVNYVIILVVLV